MTRDVLLHGLLLLHALAACGLFLYGLNCYVLLVLHRRAWRTRRQPETAGPPAWQASAPAPPRVTVQLPLQRALRDRAAGRGGDAPALSPRPVGDPAARRLHG